MKLIHWLKFAPHLFVSTTFQQRNNTYEVGVVVCRQWAPLDSLAYTIAPLVKKSWVRNSGLGFPEKKKIGQKIPGKEEKNHEAIRTSVLEFLKIKNINLRIP